MLKHQVYQLWSYPLPLSTLETLNPALTIYLKNYQQKLSARQKLRELTCGLCLRVCAMCMCSISKHRCQDDHGVD
jgi:hypothetical protein